MSEQPDQANEFIRKKLGSKADDALAAATFNVINGGKEGGGGGPGGGAPETKQLSWVKLPTLKWRLSQMAQQVGQIMATEEMFSREGVPIIVDPATGQMQGITAQKLRSELEKWIVFWKGKAGQNAEGEETTVKVEVSMTVDVARGLLEATEFTSRLRPISRVNKVRMPVLRPGGTYELLAEGYDEQSGIYTLRSGLKIDEEMPLDKARAVLDHRFREFPFEDARSYAVQLAAMESMFGACMLPPGASRMGFVWRSNDRGGGKSLLAQMSSTPVFGEPSTTDIRDRNKLAEALDSAALQGDPYLFFDNLEGTVKNTMIDNFITAPARKVRLFHTQKTVDARVMTTLLFTGNNLEVSPDIDRRTLLCRLFVPEFDLGDRRIENEVDVVKLMEPVVRCEMLSALWSLVRNWVAKGCPPASAPGRPCYYRPSFKQWSEVIGGIVQAAGYENPLLPPSDEKSAAPERVQQRRLVEKLADLIPLGETRRLINDFQDIVDICFEEELFGDKLLDGSKSWTEGEGDGARMVYKPSASALSWLGRFMALSVCGRPEGRDYTVPPERGKTEPRKVRIGYAGKGKYRNYWIERR